MASAGTGIANAFKNDASNSAMDDMLAPLERNVKTYLTETISRDLVELLAVASVERPKDLHLWLAEKLLAKSPQSKEFAIVRTDGKGAAR